MTTTFFFVVVLIGLPFAYFGLAVLMPWVNSLFSLVWEDPSDKQRRLILRRLKELHIDGEVPAASAVLMTAREFHTTEYRLLGVLGVGDSSEVPALLRGRRDGLGGLLHAINSALTRKA